LTLPSYFIIHQYKEVSIWQTRINIRDIRLFTIASCGGRVEYLHRSLASGRRRRKGNPMPGGITGPPCSWGT
jgi:hypothetical protein